MKDPAHPIWKLLRLIVVGIILTVMLEINYRHGLVPKDLGTIITVLAGTGLFDFLKKRLTKETEE